MEEEKNKITESIMYPFLFVAILWIIKLSEIFLTTSLAPLGILPRTLNGLFGIATAPLLHGDIYHLGSNTLPLLILGIIIMYFYRSTAAILFAWIYLFTGLIVWLIGDGTGYHIGASGLIYGFVSFLFFSGLFRKDRRSLALALLVTFVYGGMVWGIFPFFSGVSWESHLFGGIIGAFCAFYYRKWDPAIEEKYDWEDEIITDDDDEIPVLATDAGEVAHYVYNVNTGKFEQQELQKKIPQNVVFKYVYMENKVNQDGEKGETGDLQNS